MFEWIKDKTFFFKRSNRLNSELKYSRKTYAESIVQLGKQLVDNRTENDSLKNKIESLQINITKYKLQNKDLLKLVNEFDNSKITKAEFIKNLRRCIK